MFKKHDIFYTSKIPEVMWYEPLYNSILANLYNLDGLSSFSDLLSIFFQASSKIQVFFNLLAFFVFHFMVCWNSKIHKITSSFLFVNEYEAWSSDWDWMIHSYL